MEVQVSDGDGQPLRREPVSRTEWSLVSRLVSQRLDLVEHSFGFAAPAEKSQRRSGLRTIHYARCQTQDPAAAVTVRGVAERVRSA
jgi:hypothetical protein